METAPLDMLAFAPHPDDAELYCGGTLLLCARDGGRVGIIDLTRAELSTRGTPERRAAETAEATRILGLAYRGNMDFPDGDISNTAGHRMALIREIRRLRPRVVLLPWHSDRHPDHEHASVVVREALFAGGLRRIATDDDAGDAQEAFRPARAYYFMLTEDFTPAFIVDISTVFERKLAAINAYGSQFHSGGTQTQSEEMEKGAETYISDPSFLPSLTGRARRLGFHIGGEYGEGFIPLQPLRLRAEWM